jgi:hypothetical protein
MKRPRISLLTAFLTMLAAAGLLALNVLPRTDHEPFFMITLTRTGWPLALSQSLRLGDTDLGDAGISIDNFRYVPQKPPFERAITCNLATAVALLAVFAFVCETLLRRRDPKP